MNQEFKLAVVGSRSFTDYLLLDKTLKEIDAKKKITLVVSGGAVGADSFANQWAKENGRAILIHYPEWHKDGKFDKGAGFKRNIKICKDCDAMVAFTNGSKGTAHSIDTATSMGKKVKVVQFMEPQIFNADIYSSFIDNKAKYDVTIKDASNTVIDSFSGIVEDKDALFMRQVIGELKGIMSVIEWAKKRGDKIIINYDYEGVYNWVADGFGEIAWNPNNKYTKGYREYVLNNLTFIEKFIKVKNKEIKNVE